MTTLFENATVIAIPLPRKKRTLLPLLIVLFLGSYGLMTMLIVEQGRTIQSQSSLIRMLLPESTELWAIRGKAIDDKNRAQAPSTQEQAPPVGTPSTHAPSAQAPSSQAAPQHHSPSGGKIAKPETQLPATPAADLLDHRRSLVTI